MRIRIFVIAVIIVITIILSRLFIYDKYKVPKGAIIDVIEKEIEVYDESVKVYDLIKEHNIQILTDNITLDTTSTGEQNVEIDYKYKGIRKYKYRIKYVVVDKTAPIFIRQPVESASFYVNEVTKEDIDKIVDKITYADNYDVFPNMNMEGEIDTAEVGTYTVTFKISDSSQNETTAKTQIIIKERLPENKDENKEESVEKEEEPTEDDFIPFEEHISTYKNDNTMVGIDISKWQGDVDFEKVKNAGCEFVIMRIGVMKDKDSELVKDKTFDNNYKKAKEAGLKVGIYVYSEANNVNTAVSNADFIIETLNGDKLDFPIAFDWESWSYFNSMEMNLHMLNEMYDAFSARLKENGYDAMLYASQNYLNNVWMDLKDYTLWVARYSTKMPEITRENNQYILWQNASTGRIDGIEGDVDLDIYYK